MTARAKVTAAEFFKLPETNRITELINGELIPPSSREPRHQLILGEALVLIRDLMPNGEVWVAPVAVYLDEYNVLEPEGMWIAENSQCSVGTEYVTGAPELVVEVFSPSTEKHDRKDKFELYERFGVREYWMIAPAPELIEVWALESGKFTRLGIYAPGETFNSPVLAGALVEVNRLFGY